MMPKKIGLSLLAFARENVIFLFSFLYEWKFNCLPCDVESGYQQYWSRHSTAILLVSARQRGGKFTCCYL